MSPPQRCLIPLHNSPQPHLAQILNPQLPLHRGEQLILGRMRHHDLAHTPQLLRHVPRRLLGRDKHILGVPHRVGVPPERGINEEPVPRVLSDQRAKGVDPIQEREGGRLVHYLGDAGAEGEDVWFVREGGKTERDMGENMCAA